MNLTLNHLDDLLDDLCEESKRYAPTVRFDNMIRDESKEQDGSYVNLPGSVEDVENSGDAASSDNTEDSDEEPDDEGRFEDADETEPELQQLQARSAGPDKIQPEAKIEPRPDEIDDTTFETEPAITMDWRGDVISHVDLSLIHI